MCNLWLNIEMFPSLVIPQLAWKQSFQRYILTKQIPKMKQICLLFCQEYLIGSTWYLFFINKCISLSVVALVTPSKGNQKQIIPSGMHLWKGHLISRVTAVDTPWGLLSSHILDKRQKFCQHSHIAPFLKSMFVWILYLQIVAPQVKKTSRESSCMCWVPLIVSK